MAASLEETLISVWRQALVEDARTVALESGSYPVRRTSRSKLREVDFEFEGQTLRGLEQNPKTSSRVARHLKTPEDADGGCRPDAPRRPPACAPACGAPDAACAGSPR